MPVLTMNDIEDLGYTVTPMEWSGVDGAPDVYCVEGYGVLTFADAADQSFIDSFCDGTANTNRTDWYALYA